MKFARHVALAVFALNLFSACGGSPSGEQSSHLNYIPWSSGSIRSSTVADARAEWLHVCFQGRVSAEDLDRAKEWTRRGILTWFRVIKTVDDAVTSNILFTCSDPDLTVRLRNGSGTSFASPSVMTIYMTRPYGTWTHELGHALAGLSDTYASGAGRCKRGQPESLMCWGAYGPRSNPDEFSTLWVDDIEGIKYTYGSIAPDDQIAPDWAGDVDLEAPLDMEEPWPGAAAEMVSYDGSLQVDVDPDLGPSKIAALRDPNSIDL